MAHDPTDLARHDVPGATASELAGASSTSGSWDEEFDIDLPVSASVEPHEGATHVARMRGNRTSFVDALSEFVRTGSDLSAPLRSPVDESDLDRVRFALEGLGPAQVVSIDRR